MHAALAGGWAWLIGMLLGFLCYMTIAWQITAPSRAMR